MVPSRCVVKILLALIALAAISACTTSVSERALPASPGTDVVVSGPEVGSAAPADADGQADESATGRAPIPPPIDPSRIPVRSASFEDFEPPAAPVRITMESLGLDAPVIPVGVVEETGEMELPGAREVAWYRYAGRPGADEGSSVVAAHVDWNGRPGPFFSLRETSVGDVLAIELDDGTVAHYRVDETVRFSKYDLPAEYFRTEGPPSLVMITCGGEFDERARSYDDNIAVIATPIDPPSATEGVDLA